MWKKGGIGFFLAANISLKCLETYSLGGCMGPGLEQTLSCASTLNFVAQGLCAGWWWGAKPQLQHPEDPPFPVLAAARCPLVPQWPWLNCPPVAQLHSVFFSLCRKNDQVLSFPYAHTIALRKCLLCPCQYKPQANWLYAFLTWAIESLPTSCSSSSIIFQIYCCTALVLHKAEHCRLLTKTSLYR